MKKTLLILFSLFIYSLAIILAYENFARTYFFPPADYAENISDPTQKTELPAPLPIPSIAQPTISPTESNPVQIEQNNTDSETSTELMIPVVGIKREQLQDTFNDARSEGRVHNAIDIIAPSGTPVVAVADGEVAKFFDSERGGITIYQYSLDRRLIYYYAHLLKRADNLKEQDFVKRGTVIGYVGDTGNAGAGNNHLHFSIAELADPKRYWEGTDINPYPLLKNGVESR